MADRSSRKRWRVLSDRKTSVLPASGRKHNFASGRSLCVERLEARELLHGGTLARSAAPAVDLSGLDCFAPASAQWGQVISVQCQVQRSGSGAAGWFKMQWYLSRDAVGSSGDILLARANGAGNTYVHTAIAATSVAGPDFSVNLQLPSALPKGWTGDRFYVIMKTDSSSLVREALENNNFGQMGDGHDRTAITITRAPQVDLQGLALAAPDSAQWGQAIRVQSQIRRTGTGAVGPFQVQWYLSRDAVGSNDDILLARSNGAGTSFSHAGIAAGSASGASFAVDLQLPVALPSGWTGESFYVIMKTDAANQVAETNEGNNFGQVGLGIDREAIAVRTTSAPKVTFRMNVLDGVGEGFNDPVLGTARRTAFQAALNVWSSVLVASYSGETVTIDAMMDPMGGSSSGAILGSSGPNYLWKLNTASGPTWYADALANHLVGRDLSSTSEMTIVFNSDVDKSSVLGNTNWYYGLDGNCGSHIDFFTVVAHEVGHGLNLLDLVNTNGTWALDAPGVYDRFLENSAGTDLTAMTATQRAAAIVGNSLFWNGAGGIQGNGGTRPKMYAPASYQGGSSVSHLDETVHRYELMSPYYSGVDHQPSAMELGMLRDIGWHLAGASGSALQAGLSTGRLSAVSGLAVAGYRAAAGSSWSTYHLPAPSSAIPSNVLADLTSRTPSSTPTVARDRVFAQWAMLDGYDAVLG